MNNSTEAPNIEMFLKRKSSKVASYQKKKGRQKKLTST